jgi:hypothetical protein
VIFGVLLAAAVVSDAKLLKKKWFKLPLLKFPSVGGFPHLSHGHESSPKIVEIVKHVPVIQKVEVIKPVEIIKTVHVPGKRAKKITGVEKYFLIFFILFISRSRERSRSH